MAYAKYNRSAVDIISPMLTINQQANQRNEAMKNRFIEGAKGLVEGGAKAYTFYQRQKKIEYIGDNELNKLKQELADAKAELETVQNQMRTIKAEDINSLDVNQDNSVPAETDVNAWGSSGGRMTEYPVNTPFGTQDASMMKVGSKALGGM
jgi:predicted lipid-binding transport protein (Tim44 family)